MGLLATGTGYAATDSILEGMASKAVSGAIDTVTGVVEIPMQTHKGYKQGFKPIRNRSGSKAVGVVIGFFRGLGHATGRTVWGAMELVGFWTANAPDNEGVGVPFDAQYAWEAGQQYSLFKLSFAEGVKPVGRKLVRGLADGVLGILELPGQTMQGAHQWHILKGVTRGVWFWLSREVYGLTNIVTCIVPNSKDNPGYHFDGEWPWTVLKKEME